MSDYVHPSALVPFQLAALLSLFRALFHFISISSLKGQYPEKKTSPTEDGSPDPALQQVYGISFINSSSLLKKNVYINNKKRSNNQYFRGD